MPDIEYAMAANWSKWVFVYRLRVVQKLVVGGRLGSFASDQLRKGLS